VKKKSSKVGSCVSKWNKQVSDVISGMTLILATAVELQEARYEEAEYKMNHRHQKLRENDRLKEDNDDMNARKAKRIKRMTEDK